MFFSGDATQAPKPTTYYLGIGLWLLLTSISVWATGESLTMSFGIPKVVAYIIGLGISLIAAAMISIIRQKRIEREVLPIILAVFAFVIVWGISLLTNTHSFFTRSSLDDIRKKELEEVSGRLDLLSSGASSILDQAIEEYNNRVESGAQAVRQQILDPENPGCGPKCEEELVKLERFLDGQITRFSDRGDIRDLATRYYRYITLDVLQPKLQSCESAKEDFINNYESPNYQEILEEIRSARINFLSVESDKIDEILALGYAKLREENERMEQSLTATSCGKLISATMEQIDEDKPYSLRLRLIPSVPRYIRKTGGFNQPTVLYAFLLALAVDIGAFIIFRYMVLGARIKETW